jgi:hypothetical protein
MNGVFFCAIRPSIGNGAATAVNDAVTALLDALCVTHQAIIGRNRLSASGGTNGFPDATKVWRARRQGLGAAAQN